MLNTNIRRWFGADRYCPGVNFIGPLDGVFGLGTSARGYVDALLHAGVPLNVFDMNDGIAGRHRVEIDYPKREIQPVNIVHMTLEHMYGQQLLERGMLAEALAYGRYNIAIVYWELDKLLPRWQPVVERFDEFWCASSFLARTISSSFSGPVHVLRPAITRPSRKPRATRASLGLPEDRFVFFYSADAGSVLGRKNPRAFLDAYVDEFAEGEGAACLVKILYGSPDNPDIAYVKQLATARSDVILFDRALATDEMDDLFSHIDCYVSPHRSEGLGLTVLEAMLARKPVIATPYGGVADFMSERTAIPLAFRMIEVGPGNEPYPADYHWADPDPASIRSSMRAVLSDRRWARAIAKEGWREARSMFALKRTGNAMKRELERIGEQLRSRGPVANFSRRELG